MAAVWAQAADAPADVVKPGDAAAGAAKSAICGACHGADGNPASSQYPRLAGQQEDYTARQLMLMKSGKRVNAVMAGFLLNLTPQDMRDLGAYFASKTPHPGVAEDKYLAEGAALFRGGDATASLPACMACHGPTGRGMPSAGYPQLAGQYADYLTLKLKDFRDGKGFSDDDRAKVMTTVAKHLTDEDIAALSSYLQGLHAAGAVK